jgi:hypothetical protein
MTLRNAQCNDEDEFSLSTSGHVVDVEGIFIACR